MKSITAIILTLATLSAAAPNPIANSNPGILSPRQGCSYACLCQADNLDPGPDPDTATCCTGGTLDTGRTVCSYSPAPPLHPSHHEVKQA